MKSSVSKMSRIKKINEIYAKNFQILKAKDLQIYELACT